MMKAYMNDTRGVSDLIYGRVKNVTDVRPLAERGLFTIDVALQ